VHYGHLVDHARDYIEHHYRRPLADRLIRALLAWVLPHPGRFRLALKAAKFGQPFEGFFRKHKALRPLAEMLRLAPTQIPLPQGGGVRGGQSDAAGEDQISLSLTHPPAPRVALLQGCAEPVLRPEIRAATIRLLERAGHQVIFAKGEACCGSLVHHMGREKAALEAARRNIDAWIAEMDGEGLAAILVTVSGCGSTIKDYAHMLRDDDAYADKAARVSALALDISEYLARIDLPESSAPPLTIAWHPPCSLQHGQKVTDAPVRLLRNAGFTVRLPADAHLCCGSAGTYNILQGEIAGQLGARKAQALRALDADIIATGNIGCATQIALHGRQPVVHLVELLDWATGGPRPAALG
jgi:glycolate oxidase iron-sulfur subunit